jgi:hypothetical protein
MATNGTHTCGAAKAGDLGELLGRFPQNEAVRRIAIAAGWRETE